MKATAPVRKVNVARIIASASKLVELAQEVALVLTVRMTIKRKPLNAVRNNLIRSLIWLN